MPDTSRLAIWVLSRLASGASLHRYGLESLHCGRHATAELFFEAAARCYRRELEVEAIARLRVHQLMARALSGRAQVGSADAHLEVERALCRLERIESPAPPFELVDSGSLLAGWLPAPATIRPAEMLSTDLAQAA